MLVRLSHGTIGLALFAVLLSAGAPAQTDILSPDDYLALKKSLGAMSPAISFLKSNPSGFIGKTVEFEGVVNGIVRYGDRVSFILKCGDETILVKSPADVPGCIQNGNTIRTLIRVGPGSTSSASDLQFVGAAYDYEVDTREKQLASKPLKETRAALVSRGSNAKNFPSSGSARGVNLSSRAMQIYEPYRKAIARFNPRLSAGEVHEITCGILAFSEHYRVDPRLVVALILVESGFKPEATSRCGAMGLGQLMPGTAAGLGVANAYDPVQNIEGSVRLIRGHLSKYGNLALALSAYNAGPGAVRKYKGVPPYRETQNYVRKVGALYRALCGK